MNYKIIRTDEYFKKLKKFIKKHPDVLNRYIKIMELLEIDPYHSISINMKYRIVIDFIIQEDKIVPIDIGTHDEVY